MCSANTETLFPAICCTFFFSFFLTLTWMKKLGLSFAWQPYHCLKPAIPSSLPFPFSFQDLHHVAKSPATEGSERPHPRTQSLQLRGPGRTVRSCGHVHAEPWGKSPPFFKDMRVTPTRHGLLWQPHHSD